MSFAIAERSFFMYKQASGRGAVYGGVLEMAGKAGVRDKLTLACQECKRRNYQTYKNKRNDPDRLDMKKFCPFCRKHTDHRETK